MFCYLDAETNGLPDENYSFNEVYMTQMAYIITDGKNIFIKKEFLIKGNYEISEEITKLTGITKVMTEKEGIDFSKVWEIFDTDLRKYNVDYIIAHNMNFDSRVVKIEYKRMKNLDNNKKKDYQEEEIDLIMFNKLKDTNKFNWSFLNQYKYDTKILNNLDIILKNNENKDLIIKDIIDLLENTKMNYKNYRDKFFKTIHIDSLPLFRKLYKKSEIGNHKLQTIHNHIVGPYVQKHTALDDCYMLKNCIDKIDFNIKYTIFN